MQQFQKIIVTNDNVQSEYLEISNYTYIILLLLCKIASALDDASVKLNYHVLWTTIIYCKFSTSLPKCSLCKCTIVNIILLTWLKFYITKISDVKTSAEQLSAETVKVTTVYPIIMEHSISSRILPNKVQL
jgi:hypothetical protein